MRFTSDKKGLDGLLRETIKSRPDAAAVGLTDGSRSLSYAQLQRHVALFADGLRSVGIRPGDIVSLVMGNSIEFVVAFLSLTWIRATAAPLNPEYRQNEFEYFFADQEAVAIIDGSGVRANSNARNAAARLGKPICETIWNDGKLEPVLRGCGPFGNPVQPTPIDPQNDIALFLHTSGTTSKPKGVPLTHRNLLASLENIISTYELDEHDRSVLVMPLFHVHGLMAGLLAPLGAGSSVYIPPSGKFSASAFWGDMIRCRATWYTAVPTIHQILLARYDSDYPRDEPPRLRFIRSCSSPLPQSVLHDMEGKFETPVLEAYAMTEASHQMASNPLPKNGPHKPGSVGTGQNVAIAILNDTVTTLDPMQIGEICVKGDNVTLGYRNNPDANRESFIEGWFLTGDQGYLDEEGYLFITGRIKEIINRGGEKIAPSRIDEVLLEHPAVAAAVAFGVPDPKYGEEVNCALILKPDVKVSAEEIKQFCLGKLSAFQTPKRIFITDRLPLTASGKIQRKKVAEHFLAHPEAAETAS